MATTGYRCANCGAERLSVTMSETKSTALYACGSQLVMPKLPYRFKEQDKWIYICGHYKGNKPSKVKN